MVDQHLNEFPAEGRHPYAGHPYPGSASARRSRRPERLAVFVAALGAAGILLAAVLVILGVKAP